MDIIVIPILASTVIISIILYLFYLTTEIDKPLTVVSYPYVISVTPSSLKNNNAVEITLSHHGSSLYGTNNTTVLISDPKGKIFSKTFTLQPEIKFNFPNDFKDPELIIGKYSVILLVNNIKQNISSGFTVLSYSPYIPLLFSFLINDGQALTIGLLISVVTIVYQFFTTRNDEHRRIINDKAIWMRDNMVEYNRLYSYCIEICRHFEIRPDLSNESSSFKIQKSSYYDKNRLLFDMFEFYLIYVEFNKKAIGYYFEDYVSEDFQDYVWAEIKKIYDEIVIFKHKDTKKFDYFKQFLDKEGNVPSFYTLSKNNEFAQYSNNLESWLGESNSDISNIEKIYAYHFVYSHVLFILSNNALSVTYSNKKKFVNELKDIYKNEEDLKRLPKFIEYTNNIIYKENKKSYFRLKINGKDLYDKKCYS